MGIGLHSKESWSSSESNQYHNASNISQEITNFTSNVNVTLNNPHSIMNGSDTAGNVEIRLRNDSLFRTFYMQPGCELIKDVAEVGSNTTVSKVIIFGVK